MQLMGGTQRGKMGKIGKDFYGESNLGLENFSISPSFPMTMAPLDNLQTYPYPILVENLPEKHKFFDPICGAGG